MIDRNPAKRTQTNNGQNNLSLNTHFITQPKKSSWYPTEGFKVVPNVGCGISGVGVGAEIGCRVSDGLEVGLLRVTVGTWVGAWCAVGNTFTDGTGVGESVEAGLAVGWAEGATPPARSTANNTVEDATEVSHTVHRARRQPSFESRTTARQYQPEHRAH